jgi:hypothetical protein
VWAVEGCNGVGRYLAQRLVADGEPVVDVPAKLSARARVFSTGQGRKTDATDAHSIAVVALRTTGLRGRGRSTTHGGVAVAGRPPRRAGTDAHVDGEPAAPAARGPGARWGEEGPHRAASTQLLAQLRPRDVVGKTRRGDISRFPTKAHFASWNGTAPIDASSGDQNRHRLSRAGNRRINRVLHIMAIVQLRHDTDGRAYFRRKVAAGKTSMEAMRCLKRRLSDAVYRQMIADAAAETTVTAVTPTRSWRRARRTSGGVYKLQRGRLQPQHRHFGEVTSRTRHHEPTPPSDDPPDPPLDTEGSQIRSGLTPR